MGKDDVILVKGLRKVYGNGEVVTEVLKGLNFSVKKGEFVGIMGPSGSGKSTTLHQLGLLDEPSDGKIVIDGESVVGLSEEEKSFFRLTHLGYVFQQYRNIPELTALENVCLPAMQKGVLRSEYLKRAKELLKIVGLEKRLSHYPSQLSGGEQQRVAIARALINEPVIFFADEPTASLDTASGDVVLQLFKDLNKKTGQTIIMVSHEPEHVKYFDRVIYIRDGKISKSPYGK